MLHILLGRARSGKSERVLREIRTLGDTSAQILLVPEHASHRAETDLLRVCGDTASRHAEVLTFKLLASRVLTLTGGAADVTLDNGGKLLALERSLQELAPALRVYRRPSQRAAFLESLLAVMEELQAYAVTPERLAQSVETLPGESGDKLRDISLLYARYLAWLQEDGRDARDRLQKMEEKLEASGYVDGKDVFLDGFAYFTGREINILKIILRRAASVTVTLLGEAGEPELFGESLRVCGRLRSLAAELSVPVTEETLPSPPVRSALDLLERAFRRECAPWQGETSSVRLYEASTAFAECEWAAAEILRLVRTQHLRFRDIAVTARSWDTYEPVLRSVFRRCGIPLYCSGRSDILEKPVLALLLGALESAANGFEQEDVFRCLKTGLAGLDAEECDRLENYVYTWDIRGAMWTRDTDWTAHPDGYGAEWDERAQARLADVNALRRRAAVPLAHLKAALTEQKNVKDKVKALYSYLEEIRLPETLQQETEALFRSGEEQRAEETAQLWGILCGVMDQFVEILGAQELGTEEFSRLMRLILTQYSVGTIPVTLDAVNGSLMTRNDRHTVRVLFLLGANDGVLPQVTEERGILKEEDRMALEAHDIRLAPFGMAQFCLEMQNIYASVARPTERLFLSYPRFDGRGAELRPSFLVGRVQHLCPGVVLEREGNDKEYRLTLPCTALEYAGEHIGGAVWQYFAADEACAPALAAMEQASHYTRGRLSVPAVRALYGESIRLSASRIDQARSCHFAYFLRYGLNAKKRETAGFDAPQSGTFIHDVLQHTLEWAKESGGLSSLSRDGLHALVNRAIERYGAEHRMELADKSARFRYLYQRLRTQTVQIVDEVVDELSVSDFEPLAFELSFGKNGTLPEIALESGDTSLFLRGKIDRVDGWIHDGKLYLRVVDYKSGKKAFDLADVRYGIGIQMLLYLFALEKDGAAYFGREIVPAGVLYLPARTPLLKGERGMSDAELAAKLHGELRRSGLLLNDPDVLRAMEHEALESPCYLPLRVSKKKDGGERNLGDYVATSAQLGKLGHYVEKLLRAMAQELSAGNIDADPYARSAQDNACRFCAFASCCHFRDGSGGDRFSYLRKTGAEEFWRTVEGKTEGGGAK